MFNPTFRFEIQSIKLFISIVRSMEKFKANDSWMNRNEWNEQRQPWLLQLDVPRQKVFQLKKRY